uniref:Semaphorin-5B-like isoform X4 n=1 Tax=Crassostrea virginica TaxID=6565 RepID=A0A8B8EJL5_CRAVI|nr:semaphorin-5B-like isoform X4 [Crassostrea virginica]
MIGLLKKSLVFYRVCTLVLVIAFIVLPGNKVSAVTCSSGWTKYGENCYRLYTTRRPWMDALKACQAVGSSLVDVGSDGEQTFVHNLARGYEFWISGSDSSTERQWLWYGSIQSWGYTKWNSGEPNDSGGEDCASLLSGGRWNDYPCSRDMAYICEQTTALDACDSTWSFRDGRCYKLFTSASTWSNALKTCQANSANLVNIADSGENSFVRGIARGNHIWMGGFDGPKEGSWAWSGGVFSFSYTNWSPGEPNNSGDEDCNMMYHDTGRWNDGRCSGSLAFVCEKYTPPINGGWSGFGSYSGCTKTCGSGTQSRSRSCNNPTPQWGGDQCPGSATQTIACNTHSCPINGNWGSWGSYGSCTKTCGGGTQQRSRSCNNPAPQYGGANCAGSSVSSQSCNTHNCPIDGQWTSWGSYGSCTVTCGGGLQSRSRSCTNPAPLYGGASCAGSSSSSQACNTHNCPIDGNWGSWGSYGSCTVTCGGGTQQRSRSCNSPAPQYGGANCAGSGVSSQSCNTHNCPIDGAWSSWGAYGTCSVTCGGGTQSRPRTCTNPTPQFGGASCVGASSSSQDCNTQVCIIDGSWGAWAAWGSCTKTCGGGRKSRTRICDNPKPANGGKECPGGSADFDDCNTAACPTVAAGTYQQLCPTGYFTCQSGGITCIQSTFQCDCAPDCDDGSDESTTYGGCTAECRSGSGQTTASLTILLGTLVCSLIAYFITSI